MMRVRRLAVILALGCVGWFGEARLSMQEASAIVCGHRFACGTDGYYFLRPLAGRTVTPNHKIVVAIVDEFAAVSPPELRLMDGTSLRSDWVSVFDGRQRYERTGPPLPTGARILVGGHRPRSCVYWTTMHSCGGGSVSECAEGQAGDCCLFGDDDAYPWQPHLWFDVAGEPAEATGSTLRDGGTPASPVADSALDAGAPLPTDAASDGSFLDQAESDYFDPTTARDSAASELTPDLTTEVGVASVESNATLADDRSQSPPTFALRCSIGSGDSPVDLYLDLGSKTVAGDIVEIDLHVTTSDARFDSPIERHLRWEAMPCMGQERREFHTLSNSFASSGGFLESVLSVQLHEYQISVAGEAGERLLGDFSSLRVPDDCVPADEIPLTWHQSRSTQRCDGAVSEFELYEEYAELNSLPALDYACEPSSTAHEEEPDTTGTEIFILEPEPEQSAEPATSPAPVASPPSVQAPPPAPHTRIENGDEASCAAAPGPAMLNGWLGCWLSLAGFAVCHRRRVR